MSKEAAARAMREARYQERVAALARSGGATAPTSRRATAPVAPPVTPPVVTSAPDAAVEGLCGHRSMNGRTCTRESGHAAKSHRYS